MRWRQDKKTGKLIPIDEAAANRDSESAGICVPNFDAFVSPVDGSLIRNMREYRDHNRRNNVVPESEFSPEFIERKTKERERVFTGQHTRQETLNRKREIYEIINRLERQNG